MASLVPLKSPHDQFILDTVHQEKRSTTIQELNDQQTCGISTEMVVSSEGLRYVVTEVPAHNISLVEPKVIITHVAPHTVHLYL